MTNIKRLVWTAFFAGIMFLASLILTVQELMQGVWIPTLVTIPLALLAYFILLHLSRRKEKTT